MPSGADEGFWETIRGLLDDKSEENVDHLSNFQFDGFTPLIFLLLTSPPIDLVEKLIQFAPKALTIKDKYGNLPLHVSCIMEASPDIVKILFKAYPKAAEVLGSEGNLPLHLALKYIASSDVTEMIFRAYPKAVQVQEGEGWLPLHFALCYDSSYDIIKMLFDEYPQAAQVKNNAGNLPFHIANIFNPSPRVIKMIFEAYPKAVEMKGILECFPLHYALYGPCHSPTAQMLFEAYPEAARWQDAMGNLPLHLACLHKSSLDIMDSLIKTYPESVHVKNMDGYTPSDCLKNCFDDEEGFFKNSLLTETVVHYASTHLVRLVLQAFPDHCTVQDEFGMVPLHYAIHYFTFDIVPVLIEAAPESCHIANENGETPVHLFQKEAAQADERGMLMLHRIAAFSNELTATSLNFFVEACPKSVSFPDKYGMFPFHHACLNKASSVEVLFLFLQLYPDIIVNNTSRTMSQKKRKRSSSIFEVLKKRMFTIANYSRAIMFRS